jgi:hypothetical protein
MPSDVSMANLKHIALILAGYAVASLTGGLAASLYMNVAADRRFGGPLEVAAFALVVGLMISFYAALPSLVAIIIGLWRPINHLLYYAVVATLIGIALPLVVPRDRGMAVAGALAGPVAGYLYWRIAGRHADDWNRVES